ncbi:spore germination protein gerkc [hydrocarbon metagenome]|uniref:Spore germination protein gerkc n=1 Tax=hydrocarbon metagenome TaxID=938273 RepID=A0A0W8E833_9ZZZZ
MRSLRLTIIIIVLLLGAGCQVQELTDSVIVAGIGMDLEDEQIRVSLQLADPTASGQGAAATGPAFRVVSETGRSFTESVRKIMLSFPRHPILSQANIMILGEELVRNDLAWIADVSLRNPDIRKNAVVVVARNATPEDILNTEVLLEPLSAAAIPKLLEIQESQVGIYQPVTYAQFLEKLSRSGVEPSVPQVSLYNTINGKAIRLDGTAVFKGRKMVGHLNAEESRGLRLISPGRTQGGLINIPAPSGGQGKVGIEMTRSQTIVEPVDIDGRIIIRIKFIGEGNYYEQTSADDILRLDNIANLEALTEHRIKIDIEACVKQAQTLESDIFGWGTMVYARDPDLWARVGDNWDQIFPGLKTDLSVDFSIRRTYLTRKSLVYK